MKKRLFFKSCLVASIALLAASCDDDANLGSVDTGKLEVPDGNVVYVTDALGKRNVTTIELNNNTVNTQLRVHAPKAVASDCNVTFAYDANALDTYNKTNGTEFVPYPEASVKFANGGNVTLAAGQNMASLDCSVSSDPSLESSKSYAIPVSVKITGEASLGQSDATYIILVNDISSLGNCAKTYVDADGNVKPGIKIFSVMEVNDTNPLNNLRYTLKNSGKYMVDALVMFSGNINYDAEAGKVYFFPNDNVSAILNNREKYLKPLQDRGMKVIMGVMCNHDRACIANLDDKSAKIFAKELKDLCDAYNLDGIFWDDEYCSPITPPPPGFVRPSVAAWSRLAYEVWKLQPERWNVAYGYSTTFQAVEVDGVQPGTFINYCLPDYSSWYSDYTDSYPGMTLAQMGGCSMQFAQSRWYASENTLRKMRDEGYGAMMVFAMDPFRSNASGESGQDGAMGKLARAFYDDEVVVDPTKYEKDW